MFRMIAITSANARIVISLELLYIENAPDFSLSFVIPYFVFAWIVNNSHTFHP